MVMGKNERTSIPMSNHFRSLVAIIPFILFILSGCATAPPEVKREPVFYPEQPALPRIQFLTSFTSSKDIEPKKSSFEMFITGSKEVIRRLDKPYGAAIYDGKIYVCDTNQTVMVFDLKKKTFEPLQGAQGRGKLAQPVNISIDKDGNKYVADPIRGQVVVFDKNDFYVTAFGEPGAWKPVDAAVFEDKVYVADSKNREVKVFNKTTGELVQSLGKQGDPKNWLVIPTNLLFDREGYLYVSDTGRFQIVKLDRDGNVRATIGQLGSQLGSFARPRGIAFDHENRLYAVDAAFDNIQIFTKEGQLLLFFGKSGNKPGDFFLPAKVVVDYDNMPYFHRYVDPQFQMEALIIVTNQFGDSMVNVYALGKEKGKKYPTEEEVRKLLEENIKKLQQEGSEKKAGEAEKKD
jgi:DNA-binding beta-propeller fold protein YncE